MTSRQRIAVLGPLPPTRGGIARHTALTVTALAHEADVKVWSYHRQYPKLFYPGGSELAADHVARDGIKERRIVDGVNPMTWARAAKEIADWEPHLLVFPVWTFFLAPASGWIARSLRKSGVVTCAIVHNVTDHEDKAWKARPSLWCLGQADRHVTHSASLAEKISVNFPGTQVEFFPHPLFDDLLPPKHLLSKEYALELLFYGLVRPYKGLDIALRALALCGRKDIRLTVAGEFWQGLAETRELIDALGISDQVQLRPEFINDADTAELFDRADAVVLPYRSVTSSGVVATAFQYQKPIIVSDHPALSDLVTAFDAGWIFPSADPQALANILASLDREATARAGSNAKSSAKILTWGNFAAKVMGRDG